MLEQAGLDTEMRWTSHPFEGLCSNRVTIAGTNIGTNGKDTSEQYCLASGYAEFMERLQNNILGSTALSGAEVFERRGFLAAPDERYATPAEIFERYVEAQVLRGEAVPPRVPNEVLEATGLMPTIARIQEGATRCGCTTPRSDVAIP